MLEGSNQFFALTLAALLFVAIFLIASPPRIDRAGTNLSLPRDNVQGDGTQNKNNTGGVSEIQKGQGTGAETLLKPFEPITNIFNTPPLSIKPPVRTLSDAELFPQLFPQFYLDQLIAMRRHFVDWGWMPPDSPSAITNEQEMYAFIGRLLDVAIAKNFYPASRVQEARDSLKNYEAFIQKKKEAIRRQQASVYRSFDLIDPEREPITAGYLAGALPFYPMTASAQSIDGIWETSPLCYKAFDSSNTTVGVDLYSFCCNCGIKFYGYVPVFMENCTIAYKEVCDVQLGCLNETCVGYRGNAIWDGMFGGTTGNTAPLTYKCGCDEPEKVYQNQQQD